MNEALKNIGADLAKIFAKTFQSEEVRKLLADTKAASDAETGTFEVVATTENIDRYQEVIKLDGWDLTHYRANPVILWGHDHNQPIGMATSVEITGGKMIVKGRFAPNEKGQEIRALYDCGVIRATSVGFIEKEREGNLITKAELLELSFVSVPANPYALTLAMEKSLNVNELVTKGIMFIEKTVDAEVAELTEEVAGEPEQEVSEEVQSAEKNFSTKQLFPVIDSLKAAIIALESLGVKSEEVEGEEEPEAVITEEDKSLAEFSAKRKLLQDAATMIGEVLAEARQVIQAQK